MCPKYRYLQLACPHPLPNFDMNPNWFHREDRLEDLQSECQMMGLMMSVPRSRRLLTDRRGLRRVGGMDYKMQLEPTDADVVFGHCDKSPSEPHCGWGKSRIEWLWQLERQQRLNQAWREPHGNIVNLARSPARSGSPISTDIRGKSKSKGKSRRHQAGCWSWMRHSCGLCLDSEDIDSVVGPCCCCRET